MMSFGFSVSDFALCAQAAYNIYQGLKRAPETCHRFSLDILHLHHLLIDLRGEIDRKNSSVNSNGWAQREPALSDHVLRCFMLLVIDIAGAQGALTGRPIGRQDLWLPGRYDNPRRPEDIEIGRWLDDCRRAGDTIRSHEQWIESLQKRFRQAIFARQIPRLRWDVADIVQKLTAEKVLMLGYVPSAHIRRLKANMRVRQQQSLINQSQSRMEISQTRLSDEIITSRQSIQESQLKLESASSRLEQSQARLEIRLQQIVEAQSRHSSPTISGSLDASSPAGRQTWMELGRLLRDEGITPSIISGNKRLLIETMKKALKDAVAASEPASFSTALEYQTPPSAQGSWKPGTHPDASVGLFGSAPAPERSFFLRSPAPNINPSVLLDQEENVAGGIQSLLKGMSDAQRPSI